MFCDSQRLCINWSWSSLQLHSVRTHVVPFQSQTSITLCDLGAFGRPIFGRQLIAALKHFEISWLPEVHSIYVYIFINNPSDKPFHIGNAYNSSLAHPSCIWHNAVVINFGDIPREQVKVV